MHFRWEGRCLAALFFAQARRDGNIVTFELFRCETEEIPSMSADYPVNDYGRDSLQVPQLL